MKALKRQKEVDMPKDILKIGGLVQTPVDRRDFHVGALFKLPTVEELPSEFTLQVLSIKNQDKEGDDDACSAYMADGMSELQEGIELWPKWGFAASKQISGGNDDWGQDLRTAFKRLTTYGSVPKNLAVKVKKPRYLDSYPAELINTARKYKKQSYLKVSPTNGMDAFDTIRATIWRFREEKRAVGFGVDWGWSPTAKIINTIKTGGGHALYTPGWKQIDDQPHLISPNSYGTGVGDNGVHYFSREVINHYYGKYGAYMVADMPREEVEYMLENGIKSEDSWIVALLKVVKSFIYNPSFTSEEKDFLINQTSLIVKQKVDMVQSPTEKLLLAATEWLGKDASPHDSAPDDLGCAESVSMIIRSSVNSDFPICLSTADLKKQLDKYFKPTLDIKPGYVLVSPTGLGNGNVSNGHTGIFLTSDRIASNSSKTGLWTDNYSLAEWIAYYRTKGDYPLFCFEPLNPK